VIDHGFVRYEVNNIFYHDVSALQPRPQIAEHGYKAGPGTLTSTGVDDDALKLRLFLLDEVED